MNYRRLYIELIIKALAENGRPKRLRDTFSGYENHHIIPKSWGGSDSSENLVRLTHRQHFTAHHLLARFYGGGMAIAFHRMSYSGKYKLTASQYESARLLALVANKSKPVSENHVKGLSSKQTVLKVGEHIVTGDKIFIAGNKHAESLGFDGRQITKAINGKNRVLSHKGYRWRYATKEEIKGFSHNSIHQQQVSSVVALPDKRNHKLKVCPYCGVMGSGGNMTRYHFVNCDKKSL